jgi:hypothetical protein
MYNTLDLSSMKVLKFVIGEIQPLIEREKPGVDKEFYLVRSVVWIGKKKPQKCYGKT